MQKLWQLNLGWDVSVTQELYTTWSNYYNHLLVLNELRIPRNINPDNRANNFDIHGFCDASEAAYGACLYIVSKDVHGNKTARLLYSKSRVAPLKGITLPRLELCGALLLSKLISSVIKILSGKVNRSYLWTDSTIVPAWIGTPPCKLKTFVANRTAEIQRLSKGSTWLHVRSKSNPADLISRGVLPEQLVNNDLWWSGPEWICFKKNWPEQQHEHNFDRVELELRPQVTCIVVHDSQFLNKYSLFSKLIRIIAYCLRFKKKSLNKDKINGTLQVQERDEVTTAVIKIIQKEYFSDEIQCLEKGNTVKRNSKLLLLHLFLDDKQILRVGGRLRNTSLSYEQKHPIILLADNQVVYNLIREQHNKLYHCGPTQLLAQVRQRYWPLAGRNAVKKVYRNCIVCFKYRPRWVIDQVLGQMVL